MNNTQLSGIDVPISSASQLATATLPKYLTLVRKETRVRDEQLEALTSLTRRLNRQRQGRGERLTENTLIRVAIDLLLDRKDDLRGTTEVELKATLGLDTEGLS